MWLWSWCFCNAYSLAEFLSNCNTADLENANLLQTGQESRWKYLARSHTHFKFDQLVTGFPHWICSAVMDRYLNSPTEQVQYNKPRFLLDSSPNNWYQDSKTPHGSVQGALDTIRVLLTQRSRYKSSGLLHFTSVQFPSFLIFNYFYISLERFIWRPF